MKKLLFFALIALSFSATAQSDSVVTTRTTHTRTVTHNHRYYYYPSTNVYYDSVGGDYYYYDAPKTKNWVKVTTLPANIIVDSTDQQVIYYNGDAIWMDNPAHVRKYKVTRKGVKAKEY